ncbi:protein translocase subunit SecD [Sphingomicrobium flavum]|uniref:protein translocase subunit SecD n=1 Tax=Sphingomicrobium flavum TaxID=1229164 RepID=UPI0021AD824D|nr:protein translocase subunit SecD [Sphingomicrobium flavum]
MLDFSKGKVLGIWLVILAGIFLSIPSLMSPAQRAAYWPEPLPQATINLGLDLAGGSYLLLEADTADLMRQRYQNMAEEVRTAMQDEGIQTSDIASSGGRVSFMVSDPTRLDAAVERLRRLSQPVQLTGARDWDVRVVNSTEIVMTPTDSGNEQALQSAVTVARDVVRRRIDPNGTKEITVRTQGVDRVEVQVPGVENPEELKELIGQTARLEFRLLCEDQGSSGIVLNALCETFPMVDGGQISLQRRVIVSGDQLISANQSYDENSRPAIAFKFNSLGAQRFGQVTQQNVGKQFAIVLDNQVLSAPTIISPILGGSGQITGNFTVESANQLAISLSSGKLPVKLNVIQEYSISGELGKDSIEKGAKASIIATLAVLIYMMMTYGRFGFYANAALVANAFLILAVMAIFNATLTLPGIAGFVLTIGAAVDANVLINERIREELRRGRKIVDAIEHGYDEAKTAIFDANITNTIAAALMFYFGSGPIRGFAVVLLIGIITSVWTAVNFTRMLVALWVKAKRPKTINI